MSANHQPRRSFSPSHTHARSSLDVDSEHPSSSSSSSSQASTSAPNGSPPVDGDAPHSLEALQKQLQQARDERDHHATQYQSLLARLTTMRTTLGNKLKQDAVRIVRFAPRLAPAASR